MAFWKLPELSAPINRIWGSQRILWASSHQLVVILPSHFITHTHTQFLWESVRTLWILILNFVLSHSTQNLLTSEQSCIILKSITKLPSDLAPIFYPTMLTIIWENSEAEAKLSKDFDISVCVWENFLMKIFFLKFLFSSRCWRNMKSHQ